HGGGLTAVVADLLHHRLEPIAGAAREDDVQAFGGKALAEPGAEPLHRSHSDDHGLLHAGLLKVTATRYGAAAARRRPAAGSSPRPRPRSGPGSRRSARPRGAPAPRRPDAAGDDPAAAARRRTRRARRRREARAPGPRAGPPRPPA